MIKKIWNEVSHFWLSYSIYETWRMFYIPLAKGSEIWNTQLVSLISYEMKMNFRSYIYLSPAFRESGGHSNSFVRPSVSPSFRLSQNFNLTDIFWSINDRALIFGMHDPCDKSSLLVPCGDLDLDFLPTSRSNLLPGGGPQFFEFACYTIYLKSKWMLM